MAAKRRMALTPELVTLCFREETQLPRDTTWTPLTDEDYLEVSKRLAETNHEEDLWVFAYGSLIWNPVFETVDRKRATAFGWHRSFSLEMTTWRATSSAIIISNLTGPTEASPVLCNHRMFQPVGNYC
jgi:cation transport protein ChaC